MISAAMRAKSEVPEAWRFVESQMRGCYKAWIEQIDEVARQRTYQLGVTGSRKRGTFKVVAIDKRHYEAWEKSSHVPALRSMRIEECSCAEFRQDGKWHQRSCTEIQP